MASSGSLQININQQNTTGTPIDVDFVLWGPFASLASSCTNISASNIVDCSYSSSATEVVDIPNANAGEYYILLVTNFNGDAGTITYQQTGGTATTNCALACTLNASNSGPVCAGSTVNLFASTVPNATYTWIGPDCFTSNLQNPTNVTVPTTPGTYVYYVTASGPAGQNCSDTTQVVVVAAPNVGSDTTIKLCSGVPLNLTTLYNTTGFTTTYTLNGAPVANPAAVTTSGQYLITAGNGSTCRDSIRVFFTSDTVAFTAAATNANCTTNGIITATPGSGILPYQYSINTNPGVFQTSNTFTAAPGTYTITMRDSLGCTSAREVTVSLTDNLSVTGQNTYLICNGASVPFALTSNAASFSWSPATGLSNPNILNPTANPSATTVYTLTATLGTCTRTYTVTVTVNTGVLVNAGPDIQIVSGEEGILNGSATGGTLASIMWTPTAGLLTPNALITTVRPPTATSLNSTTYTLTVTNTDGCVGSDEAVVTVIPFCLKVRNAFTPNGDGINENWLVYDDFSCLKNVTVQVFNRYGNKVYENTQYRNNWNGTFKGKAIPDGTYYGVVEFELITGRKVTIKTDLTVLR